MGVKFAGARSVDERRRRRIVSEHDSQPVSPAQVVGNPGYRHIKRFDPIIKQEAEPARSPIASLIPRQNWKVTLVCLLIPLSVGLLYVSGTTWVWGHETCFRGLINVENGTTWRFLEGLFLIGSAGLCWLISWFRSASVRDFEGCFKSWYWSGWILLIMGLISGTDTHRIFSLAFQDYARLSGANFRTLIWVAPMVAFLSEPFRCFVREMWHCRLSWSVMWTTCCAGILYLWARLEGDHQNGILSAGQLQWLAGLAALITPTLIFSALFSQVQYVMYVNADPVPRRSSWVIRKIGAVMNGCATGISTLVGGFSNGLGNGFSQWKTSSEEKRLLKIEARNERLQKLTAEQTRKAEQKQKLLADKQRLAEEQAFKKREQAAEKTRIAEEKRQQAAEKTRIAREKAAEQEAQRKQLLEKQQAEKSAATAKRAESERQAEEEIVQARAERATKPRIRLKSNPASSVVAEAELQAEIEETVQASEVKEIRESRVAESSHEIEENSRSQRQSRQTKNAHQQNSSRNEHEVKNELDFYDSEANQDDGDDDDMDQAGTIDPNLLKGLSKKERRKLRKLHRDQQRSKAG